MNVRTATKAIIIEEGKILCSQFRSERTGKIYYGLPGGGQDHEESLREAEVESPIEYKGSSFRPLVGDER
ncbi:MAG: hypothetical protein AAFP02_22865, partial [Bacteroidota bacterium]